MTTHQGRRTVALRWMQRRDLEQALDHDRRAYVRERSAAVLKVAEGTSAHAVARHGLLKPRDPDTVYAWLIQAATVRPLQRSLYPPQALISLPMLPPVRPAATHSRAGCSVVTGAAGL